MSQDLHAQAIVIDAVCPLACDFPYLDAYKRGGLTALAPSVNRDNPADTLKVLGGFLRLVREREDLTHIRRAADIEQAKRDGKLGIIFHFQGIEPFEDQLDLVDAYKALGVGMIQLSYNVRNRVGDGCEEPSDVGLSRFGRKLVKRLNDARVIVDCAHTGERTSLEAIAASTRPAVVSHAACRAVHDVARNVSDTLLRAVAHSGGLVGLAGFSGFLSDSPRPSMAQFIAHIDHIAQVAGIDHVGLGLDYFQMQHPYTDDAVAKAFYEQLLASGYWTPQAYPPPPYYYPEGIETPDTLYNLTAGLKARGYADADVLKVLGGNWVRVFRDVWGG